MSDLKPFLKLMRALESSGGRNTAHRTMASGIHEGDAAVGAAGLMPNTAKEMAGRRLASGEGNYADTLIREANNEEAAAMLKSNPELQDAYTQDLGTRVLKTTQGDPALAATAWLYGHNLPKPRLQQLLESNPKYQERINREIGELSLQSEAPVYTVPSLEQSYQQSLRPNIQPMSKLRNLILKK